MRTVAQKQAQQRRVYAIADGIMAELYPGWQRPKKPKRRARTLKDAQALIESVERRVSQ